jgi:hypothetical protein
LFCFNKREARGADITMESETFVVLTDAPDSCRHPLPAITTAPDQREGVLGDYS